MGRVSSVTYEDGVAVAKLDLDGSARGKIHDDATARIIPRSALQDLMVDITAGTPGSASLPEGTRLAAAGDSTTVGADKVLDVLDADTRSQVQILLDQLAQGLHGRSSAFRGDLAELGRVVDSTTAVTSALADRRAQLSRFVGDLNQIGTSLAQRQSSLTDSIDVAQRTVAVTANRDTQLADTMRQLPPTLDNVGRALNAVHDLGVPLTPALERLQPLARKLPGTLASLRRFTPAGNQLISDVQDLASRGRAPLAHVKAALDQLQPAAVGLKPPVLKALPVIQAIDKNKEGIGQLGDRFSGVFSTNDANGPILRGLGFFEDLDPTDLGFSASTRGTAQAKTAAAQALTDVCLKENALACLVRYLVPGLAGAVAPTTPAVDPEPAAKGGGK
jgi:ABC-type transporter Mla subunit MlaD